MGNIQSYLTNDSKSLNNEQSASVDKPLMIIDKPLGMMEPRLEDDEMTMKEDLLKYNQELWKIIDTRLTEEREYTDEEKQNINNIFNKIKLISEKYKQLNPEEQDKLQQEQLKLIEQDIREDNERINRYMSRRNEQFELPYERYTVNNRNCINCNKHINNDAHKFCLGCYNKHCKNCQIKLKKDENEVCNKCRDKLTCTKCGYFTPYYNNFQKHINNRKTPCDYKRCINCKCGLFGNYNEVCEKCKDKLICNKCGYYTSNYSNFQKHIKHRKIPCDYYLQKEFVCKMCMYGTDNERLLEKHKTGDKHKHQVEERTKLNELIENNRKKIEEYRYKNKNTDEEGYYCRKCQYYNKTPSAFIKHLQGKSHNEP
jgi:hypothetical protein